MQPGKLLYITTTFYNKANFSTAYLCHLNNLIFVLKIKIVIFIHFELVGITNYILIRTIFEKLTFETILLQNVAGN